MNDSNINITFEVTIEEANYILAGIQEIPAKLANPLTEKLKAQAEKQIEAIKAAQAE